MSVLHKHCMCHQMSSEQKIFKKNPRVNLNFAHRENIGVIKANTLSFFLLIYKSKRTIVYE